MAISQTGELSYKSLDGLGKEYREPLGSVSLDLMSTDVRVANAQKIDTFTRAVNALTKNNFKGAEVVYTADVTAILAEAD